MAVIFSVFSFFYLAFASWVYNSKKINKYLFCVFVSLLSGLFSIYFSHDALAYKNIFLNYSVSGFSKIFDEMANYELFFLFFMKAFSFLPVEMFFCIVAILSFYIKITLIEKVSRDSLLSLICFFSVFFLYFDGTVVRVSMGIAIAYWGVYFLSKNKFLNFSIIVFSACLFFHYSLFVLIIMPLFRSRFSVKVTLALIFIFFMMYVMGVGILDPILWMMSYLDTSIPGLNKFNSYLLHSQSGDPYSLVLIFLFLACLITYYFFIRELSDFELISYNMIFLSFLFLIVFYQNQVFQNRFSEIFRYSLVFISPLFYRFLYCFSNSRVFSLAVYLFFMSGYFFYFYLYKEIIYDGNLKIISLFI